MPTAARVAAAGILLDCGWGTQQDVVDSEPKATIRKISGDSSDSDDSTKMIDVTLNRLKRTV